MANAKSTLSTLTFVQAVQPSSRAAVSPTERRRTALVDRVDEQIALATALIEGKKPNFNRTVKDKTTGEKVTKTKNVRSWFWPQGSKYLVTIKYGLSVLQFAKGANAIEAPNLKGVVVVLNAVKTAAQAGELDAAIESVAAKREKKSNAK
ncbi:MAG TPA: hypothetical protein VGI45_09185 [Terracidiphilus sp.]|jgi:hypothetical protein